MKSVGGVPTWCPALLIRKGRNMNGTDKTKHIHHWRPMTTGKRNAQGEAVQELRCDCNMTYAEWQGMGHPA